MKNMMNILLFSAYYAYCDQLLLFIFHKVNTNFTAVYRNLTSRDILDVFISYTIAAFLNLRIIRTLFDGVSC